MLDTPNAADPILREADRRLASPAQAVPTVLRHEVDGMVVVAEVQLAGRRFIVIADIDREVDRAGWFNYAELRNPPPWTTEEQDALIAQVVCEAWESPDQSPKHPHQTVGQIAGEWERDVLDHEHEGPTQRIAVVSNFDLVFGELAVKAGGR